MPSSTATIRSATASSTARSCETSSTVPGNASSAASSASRLSRSRWFVGSSSTRKFAPEATTSASASRRRSPPDSATTGLSWSSQPEKRKRPSSACAWPRCRPVAPIVHSSTLPRSSSSTSCWEKYASSTPWPIRPISPADDRLEQRRLARAVRADQGHVLAALEHELGVREQRLRARCEVEALGLDHRPPAPRRLQELEAERAPLAARRLDAHGFDARDLLQLRLGLPRLRPEAEAGDEALEPCDVLRLALGPLGLVDEPRRLLLAPDVPLAGEEGRAPVLELEHRGRHRLQEPAVVRDEDDGGVDRRQLLLEPLDRGHVEMVRRLVEEQAGRGYPRARVRATRASARRRRTFRGRGRSRRRRSRARAGRPSRGRASRSRLRAPGAPGSRRSAARSPACGRRRPSPPRAGATRARPRPDRRRRRARTRAGRSPRPGAAAGRAARRVRPSPRPARHRPARSRRSGPGAASSCRPRSGRRAPAGRDAPP